MGTENKVGVGCGVILFNKQGQFVLLKRLSSYGNNTYSIVGGWIEFGESFEECIIRETKEEIGPSVEIENIKILGISNNIFSKENKHTVSIILGATIKSGEPQNNEPEKCEEVLWCDDWNNLPQPTFIDYTKCISKEKISEYLKSVI